MINKMDENYLDRGGPGHHVPRLGEVSLCEGCQESCREMSPCTCCLDHLAEHAPSVELMELPSVREFVDVVAWETHLVLGVEEERVLELAVALYREGLRLRERAEDEMAEEVLPR